ncbi:hypothetical protein VTN00DRAFT_8943 [Thermoascus crustaceus]|uniref:uncharacterized protein n=1 Tax=Thermoascus crustaceus TaxID=5088 RepID=UPI003744B03A
MSERKVLTKHYQPDIDPSKISRQRETQQSGPKLQTVRLMSPLSMRCNRMRNARIDRAQAQLSSSSVEQDARRRDAKHQAAQQQDLEDEEAARRAFLSQERCGRTHCQDGL